MHRDTAFARTAKTPAAVNDPSISNAQLLRRSFAFILAGGRGTRLAQLTDGQAKPAVPFGGKFRIIDFTLSNCVNSGLRRIGVATQYKAHSLIRHLARGWSFLDGRFQEFIEVMPAQQQLDDESWYRGTADAVYQNLQFIQRYEPAYVMILSGDHIYKMDYGAMLASHVRSGAAVTVACTEVPVEEARPFGIMTVDAGDRIVQFNEKPAKPTPIPGNPAHALASMGVYAFDAAALYEQLERDAMDPRSSRDFAKDVITAMVGRTHVHAHRFADSCVGSGDSPYWRDVGTVDAFWEANMELTKVIPELDLYDESWPVWTHQEQLPPAKFVFDDNDRRGMAVDSLVSGGCVVSGGVVRRSLLFSKVRVDNLSEIEDTVALPGVRIGTNVRIRRAVLDEGCIVPDDLSIGFNPTVDREWFHVTERGITLVTPKMLEVLSTRRLPPGTRGADGRHASGEDVSAYLRRQRQRPPSRVNTI
jgi:glucose-1-phosphate adenylyltransferase